MPEEGRLSGEAATVPAVARETGNRTGREEEVEEAAAGRLMHAAEAVDAVPGTGGVTECPEPGDEGANVKTRRNCCDSFC